MQVDEKVETKKYYSKEYDFEFKAGQVFLVNTKKGFVPKAIKFFTKCKYNHVAILTEYLGDLYITEAIAKGFVPTQTLESYLQEIKDKKKEILVLEPIQMYAQPLAVTYNRLKDVANKGYEFANLVFHQLVKQISGGKWWIGTKNAKRVICSEAVAYAFPSIFSDFWKVDPEDFFKCPYFTHLKEVK